LNVFFRIGTFIGTDTPFQEIKADPPDYGWAASRQLVSGSRAATIDQYIDLFRQAIARCSTENREVSLGLSGGRDSRHILFELCANRREPSYCWTVNTPHKPDEVTVAAQLCNRLGVKHVISRLERPFSKIEPYKNSLTAFSSLQHAWMAEAVLNGVIDTPVIFDGIGGDVLSAGLFLNDKRVQLLNQNRLDELVEEIVGPYNLFMFRDPSLFPRSKALEKVDEELRKHLKAPDPISSFYFWNRTRRDIGCSAFALLKANREAVFAPFLDPDLCSFLAGLPPSVTCDHQLHTEVIAKAYPQYAGIPYAHQSVDAIKHNRKIALNMLQYLLLNSSPEIDRKKVFLQLLRAATFASHSSDVQYLGPYTVYMTQLSRMVRN
jgi:hypothetical protein